MEVAVACEAWPSAGGNACGLGSVSHACGSISTCRPIHSPHVCLHYCRVLLGPVGLAASALLPEDMDDVLQAVASGSGEPLITITPDAVAPAAPVTTAHALSFSHICSFISPSEIAAGEVLSFPCCAVFTFSYLPCPALLNVQIVRLRVWSSCFVLQSKVRCNSFQVWTLIVVGMLHHQSCGAH